MYHTTQSAKAMIRWVHAPKRFYGLYFTTVCHNAAPSLSSLMGRNDFWRMISHSWPASSKVDKETKFYVILIITINALIWKKLVWRSLRLKDVWGWILKFWSQNCFSPKYVGQTSVWQTVPKVWFIWLCYLSFCIASQILWHSQNILTLQEPLWDFFN